MPARERESSAFELLCPDTDGDGEIRTLDPLLARQVLSQLSYTPIMGLSGLEPPTSRLSGVRSNRLSYKPFWGSGTHLLSHIVSNIVSSAAWVLTVVFGMGTGVTPRRIGTGKIEYLASVFRTLSTKLVRRLPAFELP